MRILDAQKHEIAEKVYSKLIYFYNNKIPVHFVVAQGYFQNGTIIDLNEEKFSLVIKEFKDGAMPHLLEDINPDSIVEYNNPNKEKQ